MAATTELPSAWAERYADGHIDEREAREAREAKEARVVLSLAMHISL